jgi:phosphoadenosine phosphosulfate reductase
MTTTTLENAALPQLDVEELNGLFAASDPEKIVAWAAGRFGADLLMTSSFGAESAALLHMATRVLPRVKVIMLDTGYLFPETWQHMEQLRQRLDLNVWVYRTRNDPIAYLHSAGEENPAFRNDRDACCAVNKNEPMNRAMKELSPRAWLRGVRRNQTPERQAMRHVEWAARYDCHAISPLLNWGSREIFTYMKKYDLPYHPLYEKGYASIGCNPLSCTRPIQIGEDSRAGRWAGSDKVECGINLTNSLDSSHL